MYVVAGYGFEKFLCFRRSKSRSGMPGALFERSVCGLEISTFYRILPGLSHTSVLGEPGGKRGGDKGWGVSSRSCFESSSSAEIMSIGLFATRLRLCYYLLRIAALVRYKV